MIETPMNEIKLSNIIRYKRIIVVDSSVGVKWFIKEDNSDIAMVLLNTDFHLIAPTCFFSEITNVLWKRAARGDITYEKGWIYLNKLKNIEIEIEPSERITMESYEIAKETGQATYDCEFLAVAIRYNAKVITADEKLYNRLSNHPAYGAYLIRLQDFKP